MKANSSILILVLFLIGCGAQDGPSLTEANLPSTGGSTPTTPPPLTQLAITGSNTISGQYFAEAGMSMSDGNITLTLTNNGTDQVDFATPTTSSLGLSGALSLTGGTCTAATSLGAGQSCTLDINYHPVTAGEVLTPNLQVPYTNSASRTGTATFALTGKSLCYQWVCRFYVTAALHDGNLGGTVGADAKCMADTNKPSNGVYKAMLSDNANRKADIGNQQDWALRATARYVRRPDSVPTHPVAIANSDNVLPASFQFIPAEDDTLNTVDVWTGLNANWSSSSTNCNGWTSNSSSVQGTHGHSVGDGQVGGGGGTTSTIINSGAANCNVTKALFCAEQ